MGADHADHGAVARGDRHAEQRLKLLLLELGNVFDPRVIEEVVGDESRLVALGRPPGEASRTLEHDVADQMLVRVAGRPEHESLAPVFDQVDEAGMDGTPFREQPHHRPQHLVELEARADG